MITTQQAAEKWGVKRRTVTAWIGRGKLPEAVKMGRDWIIPSDTPRPADRRYVDEPVRNRRKNEPR